MYRIIKLTVKYFLISAMFVSCFGGAMRLLQDVHKKDIRNGSDVFPFVVIVQTAKGIDEVWGREELNNFMSESKDVRFLIQPSELEQIKYHFNKGREKGHRAIGMNAGPILDAKQEIKITAEAGPGLYSFAYEATANGITPLYTTRFTIIDAAVVFGIAAFVTMIILIAAKKARKWLLPPAD